MAPLQDSALRLSDARKTRLEVFFHFIIYIYIYITEAFETPTIFHVTTIFFSFYFRFYILYIYYNSLV